MFSRFYNINFIRYLNIDAAVKTSLIMQAAFIWLTRLTPDSKQPKAKKQEKFTDD